MMDKPRRTFPILGTQKNMLFTFLPNITRGTSGPGTFVKTSVDFAATRLVMSFATGGGSKSLRNLMSKSLKTASGDRFSSFIFLVVFTILSLEPPEPRGSGRKIIENRFPKCSLSFSVRRFTGIVPSTCRGIAEFVGRCSVIYLSTAAPRHDMRISFRVTFILSLTFFTAARDIPAL